MGLTPFLELDNLIHLLLQNVRTILGPHFTGMYLEGSLANDAFDRASDIDFVVVSDEDITRELFLELQAMHSHIATLDARWGHELEGFYVGPQALKHNSTGKHLMCPNLERGPGERLKMVTLNESWLIHRAILRERGITLEGPPPKTLVDPVTPAELRQAMLASLREWPASILQKPEQLGSWGSCAYVVITLCRMLYTLQNGTVSSKEGASRWAQETLDSRWKPLIEQSWLWRYHPQEAVPAEEVKETLNFIRYVQGYSRNIAEAENRGEPV